MNKKLWLYVGIVIVIVAAGVGVYALASNYHSPASTNGQTQSNGANPVKTTSVQIKNFAFSPTSIRINLGDTVTWTNNDGTPHTVTKDGGYGPDSSSVSPGSTYTFTYTKKGTFSYHCSIHPDMTGKVVVE